MPILEKFVTFTRSESLDNDDIGYRQESISGNEGDPSTYGGLLMMDTNEHEINRKLS